MSAETEANAATRPPSRRREPGDALILAAVLATTLIVYLRCLGNGFLVVDDWLITNNPYLGQWSFLWKSLLRDWYWILDPRRQNSARYRPLGLIWFALNYHLFGLKPLGWHAGMVAGHLLVVWLVYKTALRLSGDRQGGLLAALLFGLTPIHGEAMAWTCSFVVVISSGLELAAFYLFIERARAWWRNWTLALGLYAGALLSYETAVTFPGLVAAYVFLLEDVPGAGDACEPGAGAVSARVRRALLSTAPFGVELVVYLIVRRLVLGSLNGSLSGVLPDTFALITLPKVLLWYLFLLVVPWWAGPVHRVLPVLSLADADFYVPLAALAAIGSAFFMVVRNSQRRRLYLFCAAWIAVAMALMIDLGARQTDQLVHDAFLYLASFAWCLLVADWAVGVARWGAAMRRLVWGAAAAVAVAYALTLWHVQHLYHDDMTFLTEAVARFPEAVMYRSLLGQELLLRGNPEAAERQLRVALSMYPGYGDALFVMGLVHAKLGRNEEADTEIARGLGRMSNPPARGYLILAERREAAGDLAGAERQLQTALGIEPENGAALYSLGRVHARLGRIAEAASEIAKALELMPHPPADAYVELAELYDAQSNQAQSQAVLKQMQAMPGGDEAAGFALARIKLRHNDIVAAEKLLRDLSGRYPRDQRAWSMLGLMLADQKRNHEALDAYRRAIQLDPNDMRPHLFAAQALHALGRDHEALEESRAALALSPEDANVLALMSEVERSLSKPPPPPL
ncbi:MAG: tetratricopeptide repeat protein [Candidatus Binataceae bacterium]